MEDRDVPVNITFVGDTFVVTGVDKSYYSENPFEAGDIILSIDGKSTKDIIEERKIYLSSSNNAALMRRISIQLFYTDKENLYIKYIRNNQVFSERIKTFHYRNVKKYNDKRFKYLFEYIDDDIGYIDLSTISGGDIPDTLHSKGLIIDIRGYPNQRFLDEYLEFYYLYNETKEAVSFTSGNPVWPGSFIHFYTTMVGKKNNDYYKGLVVVLVNEETLSHGEYMAMRYSCAPNSIILGSTTAGADGGVAGLPLPGGFRIPIGVRGVYYPDGRETQRIGIVPDIVVRPTIKGIREKRDEVLEKAIELINEMPSQYNNMELSK
jgi:C-terminal processing protease CtpA/Prc